MSLRVIVDIHESSSEIGRKLPKLGGKNENALFWRARRACIISVFFYNLL
jgi:hypothetical protein